MSASGRRQGQPWSSDELAELVSFIRRGCTRTEIARTLGRTSGALAAVADRLISPDRRPANRSDSWKLLCQDVASSDPADDPDWWTRYTIGRSMPRPVRPTSIPTPTPKPKPPCPVAVPPASTFMAPPSLGLDHASAADIWGHLVSAAAGELPDDRERYILLSRLGLLDEPNTLRAIGDALGISDERVRQLEDKALVRITRSANQPGTTAEILAFVIELLSNESDHTLVARLVDSAGTLFRCQPVWMVKAVARMAGLPLTRADPLGELAREYIAYQRDQARKHAHEQQHQEKIERYLDKWLRDAVWPASISALPDVAEPIRRERMPNTHDRVGYSGSFHSEKMNSTVRFESLLEEAAFTVAERSNRVHSYQEQPCKVHYSRIDGERSIYIPDLLICLTDGRMLLIEVKPLWQMAVSDNLLKSQAGQRFAAERGWGWVTVAHAGRTYTDLLERDIDPAAHRALTHALAAGPITWPTMLELRQRIRLTALDVAAYAAQGGVALSLTPYRLGVGR